MVLKLAFILISFLSILGCSSIPSTSLPPTLQTTVDQRSLEGWVNGIAFHGVGVIPWSSQYTIKIYSTVNVDYLTISTCARNVVVSNAINVSFGHWKYEYDYTFVPGPFENHGSCPLIIEGFNKTSTTKNQFAILDFETPDATLPAKSICNGDVVPTQGVSFCQSKAALIQGLFFQSPVVAKSMEADCTPTSTDNLVWKLRLPLGLCTVAFMSKSSPHTIHRAQFFGYNQAVAKWQ